MVALRLAAAALAILGVLPLWRILPQRATGLAGLASAEAAASYSALIWNGLLLALIPAVLCALLLDSNRTEAFLRKMTAPLTRARPPVFALAVAILATVLACVVAFVILDARPTLIDSFAQLLQARYLAAGRLAGPVTAAQSAWHIQQTIITANGWVSQYPPGYIVLLAAGFVVGAPALIGPLMLGVAVFFTSLIADEVFEDRSLARVAAILAAVSPFMLGMAGAFMSHVPACAFGCAALYFTLRANRGHWTWSAAAGASIGLLFSVRPLTGVVAGAVALGYAIINKRTSKVVVALVAATPFLVLVALYNAHFFGSATTFGYTKALGQHAGLGFGLDPWGNHFGPAESLAYTSAELSALNVFLLEVPLPITLLIGLYFALSRTRTVSNSRNLLFVWVSALVAANLFYWHHGLFMGPRMLADAGTLWVLLAAMSAAGLVKMIRADWLIAEKYSVRSFATGGIIAMLLAGILVFAPQRLLSYQPSAGMKSLLAAPQVQHNTVAFVHGGWTARVAMRLAAAGMRLDSVEIALRQNGTCSVHNYSVAYARHEAVLPHLVFSAEPVVPTKVLQIAPGDRMRTTQNEKIDAGCMREIASDTAGVIDVSPYVWQGDLPGVRGDHPLFARDMGRAENQRVLSLYPKRSAVMLTERGDSIGWEPYEQGMRSRWGSSQ